MNGYFKKNKKYLIKFVLFFLFLESITFAASFPEFERLPSITANLKAPTSVALDKHEYIYITESTHNILNVYTQSGVYLKNLSGLNKPISVAVDDDGRIFVGNKNTGNVEAYDEDLNFLFKLGTGDWEFAQPGAIAIESSGNIYVVDSGKDLVRVYDNEGVLALTFGGPGVGDGEFTFPTGIAVNEATEELIVVDRKLTTDMYGGQIQGARIQVLDLNGVFKRSFGEYGAGAGFLSRPVGVEVDGEGRIYVADAMQHVIHVFDGSDGTSLGTIYDIDNPMRTPLHVVYGNSNRLFITSLNTGKLEIFGLDSYTNMRITPSSLNFKGEANGTPPASQNIIIANNGNGTINWTAASDNDWMTVSAASGSTAVSGTSTLNIGVTLSGLTAGTYTGHVTISSGSAADILTVNLTVSAIPLPLANAGGPYSAVEGNAVIFDGSGSTGSISLYEWDIDNDGTFDYTSSSAVQSHAYLADGTYTVKLRVSDTENNISEDMATVIISDTTPNASFTASPTTGSGPLLVGFTNSSTGHDQALTYAWDFDFDGTTDSVLENPSHVYTTAGTYIVSLTVTDSDGSTDTIKRSNYITVIPGSGLPGCLNSPIKRGLFYHTTIQSAYNAAAEGEVIKLHGQDISFSSLSIDRDVTVTLQGGYDCDYSGINGRTTMNGNMNVNTGTIIIGDIILE